MVQYDNGDTAQLNNAQVRAIVMDEVPMNYELLGKRVRKNFPLYGGMFEGTIASYEYVD